jgi:asparagine synthase (glutamine-hydrolysing)
MPIDEPVYYKRSSDYVDRFTELLTLSIRDRTRTPWIGVFMSGGLDSSSLAAAACKFSNSRPTVEAFTNVFDHLIPDDERYYAGLVAQRLGIPIHYRACDDKQMDPEWGSRRFRTPEPAVYSVKRAYKLDEYRGLAKQGRVFFFGEGSDNALMYEWQPYVKYLVRNRRWSRLIRDIFRHGIAHRRILPMAAILNYVKPSAFKMPQAEFPPWLDETFASRTDARGRWEAMEVLEDSRHPFRPIGFHSFASASWSRLFESMDPGFTEAPVEFWHPYVDLRLVRYMLSVPSLPWCRRKYLLRQAMRNILPEEVLRTSTDSARVREAWEARKQIGPVVADDLRQIAHLRNEAARAVGFADFWHAQLLLDELVPEQLVDTLNQVEAATRQPFLAMKAQLDHHLAERFGVDPGDLRPWHYGDPFFQETPEVFAPPADPLFA